MQKTPMKTGSQLQHDSGAEFMCEFFLHAWHIGVVDLIGEEDSYQKNLDSERRAKHLAAVRAVVVDLTIQRREFKVRTGAAIAAPTTSAEQCPSSLPKDQVLKHEEALRLNRYVLLAHGSSEGRPGPSRHCPNPKPSRWLSRSRLTRCAAVALR